MVSTLPFCYLGITVSSDLLWSDVTRFVDKLYVRFIKSGLVVVKVALPGDWGTILVGDVAG